jgi:hypothetical protein
MGEASSEVGLLDVFKEVYELLDHNSRRVAQTLLVHLPVLGCLSRAALGRSRPS